MSTAAPITLRAKFANAIAARQRVWTHDRSKTLGASETFACLRRAWFGKFRPDLKVPQDMGAAERGNVMEKHHVVPTLQQIYGFENCLYMSDDQDTLIFGLSSATPDGLIVNQPLDVFAADGLGSIEADCFACEIKSFDPRAHIEEEKAIHHGQAMMQLGMYRQLSDYKPEYAVVLYVNASIYTDVRPFFIKWDEKLFHAGLARARKLFDTKDPYELLAEGALTDQCKHCPYIGACRDAEIKHWPSDTKNMDPETVEEVYEVARKRYEAHTAAKAADAHKKGIDETIKRKLADLGTKSVDDPRFKITYSKMEGRDSLDKTALEVFLQPHGLTLEDFQQSGNDYTRLTVTMRGEKGAA